MKEKERKKETTLSKWDKKYRGSIPNKEFSYSVILQKRSRVRRGKERKKDGESWNH